MACNFSLTRDLFEPAKAIVAKVRILLVATVACLSVFTSQSLAQTPDADADAMQPPDFSGEWTFRWLTPLERPEGVGDLQVSEDEAAKLVAALRARYDQIFLEPDYYIQAVSQLSVIGEEHRTSLIVKPGDGRLPYTQIGASRASQVSPFPGFDDPEQRPLYERCMAGLRAPFLTMPFQHRLRIVQTGTNLVFQSEDVSAIRIIRIDGDPQPREIYSWEGSSVGQWENEELVIETTNFHPGDTTRFSLGPAFLVQRDSKVIERLRLISHDEILYQFTVEDPELYDEAWLAEFVISRLDGDVLEFACHEGNQSLPNILRGARVQEAR